MQLYDIGWKYDMKRRGFEIKDTATPEEWKKIREDLYTPDELKAQEDAIRELKK